MPDTMIQEQRSGGGVLVSLEGKTLPLRGVSLQAVAEAGLARVILGQLFANPYEEPLKVVYSIPLPAEGAVGGYEVRIGPRVIRGVIDTRKAAREKFEEALVEGKIASILDQERTSVFTQELGNVPPHTEVEVRLTIDHRLAWLNEGMWEWRFPTVVSPRYLGAEGRVPDADRIEQPVAEGDTGIRTSMELEIGDDLAGMRPPVSVSHAIAVSGSKVTLPEAGAALDRDIVVRWGAARPQSELHLRSARPGAGSALAGSAYGLLTIVPPAVAGEPLPRDLIVLIDTSGSMSGLPLQQAKRLVRSAIETLGDADSLEMIAFSSAPRRWKRRAVQAKAEARREAVDWVGGLTANGGTEMVSAIEEALTPLREGTQRQVVLVTDGQIGFETEVVHRLRDTLPEGSRLHAVGVGSAVNRSLTRPAARAGRGVEIIVDLGEDAGRGAARLTAALRNPVVVDLSISGSALAEAAPRRPADLLAGAPILAGLRLKPEGGDLIVRGRTASGEWEQHLAVPPTGEGAGSPAIVALFGREKVEDLEMDLAAGAERRTIERDIERTGLEYGIATRLTSWVAVSEEPDVDPKLPVRRERIPQTLPYGVSAEGLGLRAASTAWSIGVSSSLAREMFPAYESSRAPEARRSRDSSKSFDRGLWDFDKTTSPGDSASPFLPGRWVRLAEPGPQILEIVNLGQISRWQPGGEARVTLRDGSEKVVRIDPAWTTRSGSVSSGLLVRLALVMPREEAEQAAVIEFRGPDGRLRVRL